MTKKAACLFSLLLLAMASTQAKAAERAVTVLAAASLTDAMEAIARAWTARTGMPVRLSFAGSSTLARQIESGAPTDLFISADQEWMDYLVARGLVRDGSRSNIATNSLVLVAPADSALRLEITRGFGLAAALGSKGRLATGDPDTVPVGRYAREALTTLGVWSTVADRLIPAENVRAALNFVALGEAPAGIVYATDARGNARIRVVATFPPDSHEPITYPAAAMPRAGTAALEFLRFLGSREAQDLLNAFGFGVP